MRLQWPITTPSLDIVVPNSQLGNTETLQSNAIIRENRGLQPITFKASSWPINTINKYSLKALTLAERVSIINFMTVTAGDEILLTDHDNYVWTGIIITAIPEMVTVRDNCSYDIEFEFMGSR